MPTVLISPEWLRHKSGPHLDLLQAAGFEIRYSKKPEFARGLGTDEETVNELSGVDATLASSENYNRRVLDALPQLKVIARTGVGFDRVDLAAATQRGVAVCITPNANHEAVAEMAMALIFGVAKQIALNDRRVRVGQWPRDVLAPIRGRTLGVFGLGRIGRSTATRALALGMNVIATEKFPDVAFVSQHGIELVEFDELLARSDYLSIHCPLNDETRGIFNRAAFAKMKVGSVLINTARGGMVVEADLHESLQSGRLRGAGMDVFEEEPPSPDNPLLKLDNVVASPHLAGADETSSAAMGVEAADCIIKLYRGQWPGTAVLNQELRDRWKWE